MEVFYIHQNKGKQGRSFSFRHFIALAVSKRDEKDHGCSGENVNANDVHKLDAEKKGILKPFWLCNVHVCDCDGNEVVEDHHRQTWMNPFLSLSQMSIKNSPPLEDVSRWPALSQFKIVNHFSSSLPSWTTFSSFSVMSNMKKCHVVRIHCILLSLAVKKK